jgi:hypothetical protein
LFGSWELPSGATTAESPIHLVNYKSSRKFSAVAVLRWQFPQSKKNGENDTNIGKTNIGRNYF